MLKKEKTKKYITNVKNILGMLAIMFLTLISTQTTTYAATEVSPGTSMDNATSVKLDTEYDASFVKGSNSHYYKIKLDKEGFVQCHLTETTNVETELNVRIAYDSDNEYERKLKLQNSTDKTHFVPLKKGTYYIRIDNKTKKACNYGLKVDFVTVDGKMEVESNDTCNTANKIEFDSIMYGAPDKTESDCYIFSIKENGYVEIDFNTGKVDGEYYTVYLGDNKGGYFEMSSKENFKSQKINLKKGTYYLDVFAGNGLTDRNKDSIYSVKLKFTKGKYGEQENNDHIEDATKVTLGKTYEGFLNEGGDYDWYKFEMKQDGFAEINLEYDTEVVPQTYEMCIFTPSHYPLNTFSEIPITNGKQPKRVIGLRKGTYCIELSKFYMSGEDCINPYKLKIEYKKSANYEMEGNNTKETANKLKLGKEINGATWDMYDTADVYKLDISSDTYVNFTVSHEKTKNKDKLWNVNIRNASGKVVLDKNVYANEGSVTSDTKKLSKGTYYVTVENKYKNAVPFEYKLVVNTVKKQTPTITKVESVAYNKIKVSWKKLSGVSKYEIYRATSKNGNYKKVKTITNPKTTSWTDKNVKTGKTYYYKMKSVIKTTKEEKSGFSKMKSAKCVPAAPEISLKAGKKQVKISWKKVSGTNGYEVYRATSKDGKYKKVKTIKKGSTLSYTDKKVTSGEKYYYKVRAYRTVSGKKVYSEFSDVKSKKAK